MGGGAAPIPIVLVHQEEMKRTKKKRIGAQKRALRRYVPAFDANGGRVFQPARRTGMSALLWIRNVRTPGKSIPVRAVEIMGIAEFIVNPSAPLRIDSADGLNPSSELAVLGVSARA